MNNIFLISYKDLGVVGEKIFLDDFQKEIKKTLKNPLEMEKILTDYQRVLNKLMKKNTVIPFQFGTILKDKKGAKSLLEASYLKFKRLLGKLKNKEEWGLRVFADMAKFQNKAKANKKEIKVKSQGQGASYLLRKKIEQEKEKEAGHKLNSLLNKLFVNLGARAFEKKITQSSQRFSEKGEVLACSFAFLLERGKVKSFSKEVGNVQKKHQPCGLRLVLSGPWPAYNFL